MRVTTKGQVTIPKDVRERLGISAGSEVGFREEEGKVIVYNLERAGEGGDESAGARLARQLIELGKRARREGLTSGLTADEIMEMTRGPFDDRKPR